MIYFKEKLFEACDDDDLLSALTALYDAEQVDGYAVEIMQAEVTK